MLFLICACICKRNCVRALTAKARQSESESCSFSATDVTGSDSHIKGEWQFWPAGFPWKHRPLQLTCMCPLAVTEEQRRLWEGEEGKKLHLSKSILTWMQLDNQQFSLTEGTSCFTTLIFHASCFIADHFWEQIYLSNHFAVFQDVFIIFSVDIRR